MCLGEMGTDSNTVTIHNKNHGRTHIESLLKETHKKYKTFNIDYQNA